MKLNDLTVSNLELNIGCDGEFEQLGLITREYCNEDKVLSYIEDKKYLDVLLNNKGISSVICVPSLEEDIKKKFNGGYCLSNEPKVTFFDIQKYLVQNTDLYSGKKPNKIAKTAEIHETAIIEGNNITIGENSVIGANTIVKENSVIEDDVIIGENCAIGRPAFYFYGTGSNRKQVLCGGGVLIKNNVNIYSNTVIQKSVFKGNTIIGNNTIIAESCVVSHDCNIGDDCTIAASTTLGGLVEIGDGTYLGIGSKVPPLVAIGKNCLLSIGAVATKDVPDNTHVSGNFAIEHEKFIKDLKKKL